MPDLILGIDPGLHGGIACTSINQTLMQVIPLPTFGKGKTKRELDPYRILEWIDSLDATIKLCVLEKVHAMPKQGVTSMFNFGMTYGILKGLIAARKYPLQLVTPQAWKKVILAGYNTSDKSGAIKYCSVRYPHISLIPPRCRTPHDGMADSLCLAVYGLNHLLGTKDATKTNGH